MFRQRRKTQNQPRTRLAASPQVRSDVFSYHANRSIREGGNNVGRGATEPPTANRSPRTHWLKRAPMLIALAVIAICCVNVMSLNSNAKIVPITNATDGTTHLFLQNTAVYQAAAQKLFAASIVNSNKLTVDTQGITAKLEKQFPELQNVSIALPLIGHRPIVYLQPASPQLFLATQGGGVYILDRSGRALMGGSQATAQVGVLPIVMVHDESGVPIRVGEIALPSNNVDFIAQLVGQLQAKGLQITSLSLPAAASELDIHLQGVGYEVRFNMQNGGREQAGAFLAAKQYLDANHIAPSQYVDVRVPMRAYYK